MQHVAIVGAGAWGSALAIHLISIGLEVRLWSRSAKVLPSGITVSSDISKVVPNAKEVICMIPSSSFVDFIDMVKPYLTPKQVVLWGCKGWAKNADSIYFDELMRARLSNDFAAISGPTFAAELAAAKPTATVIAGYDSKVVDAVIKRFHGGCLRCYGSNDVRSVQFCGVYKNIIAVAAGIADGLVLGANARSALITRGIAEMLKAATVMKLSTKPIYGLAGIGDVMLSATSDLSRNRKLGLALGQGMQLDAIKAQPGMGTLESITNLQMMLDIAQKHSIELPICNSVNNIVTGKSEVAVELDRLLLRQPVYE